MPLEAAARESLWLELDSSLPLMSPPRPFWRLAAVRLVKCSPAIRVALSRLSRCPQVGQTATSPCGSETISASDLHVPQTTLNSPAIIESSPPEVLTQFSRVRKGQSPQQKGPIRWAPRWVTCRPLGLLDDVAQRVLRLLDPPDALSDAFPTVAPIAGRWIRS